MRKALKYWRKGKEEFKSYLTWQMTEDIYKLYHRIDGKLTYCKNSSNKDELIGMKAALHEYFQEYNMKKLNWAKESLEEALQMVNEGIEKGYLGYWNVEPVRRKCFDTWKYLMQYDRGADKEREKTA